MLEPEIPENEDARMDAIHSYNIMDTLPEADYDNITRIASSICETPVSLITFVEGDRQWFKSKQGLTMDSTPRNQAFCAHGILEPMNPLIITDTAKDERFSDNPLVTGPTQIAFYAGIPLVDEDGFALGSLCVIDHKSRELNANQLLSLKALARQTVQLLKLRRTVDKLEQMQNSLQESNDNLEEFAYIVSHDIKAPLRNIRQFSELIKEDSKGKLDNDVNQWLELIHSTSLEGLDLINGVLKYSKVMQSIRTDIKSVDLGHFVNQIWERINAPKHIIFSFNSKLQTVHTSELALGQILRNLFENAIKYNDKEEGRIELNCEANDSFYLFSFKDNGQGIPENKLSAVLALFYRASEGDQQSKESSGIGLAIVQKLIEKFRG